MTLVRPSSPKRQLIIKAATKMFLAYGYRNVSMDKIAQASPVSKATLYKHFTHKSELLAGVVSELCESLLQTMAGAHHDHESVEQTLKNIARAFVDLIYSEEALAIYRLVIAESREFPELSQLFYNKGPLTSLTRLDSYLRELKTSGQLIDHDSAFLADAFFSLLKGNLHMQCLLGIKPPPSEEEKNQLIVQALDFYWRGFRKTDA